MRGCGSVMSEENRVIKEARVCGEGSDRCVYDVRKPRALPESRDRHAHLFQVRGKHQVC